MLRLIALLPLLLAAPVVAQDAQERPFCADRPGLNTPPCTLSPGVVQAEVGLGDLTRDRVDGARTDTLLLGTPVVRVGLTDSLEAQVGWTAFGRATTRFAGVRDRRSSTGDVTLSLRQNLMNPDGSGTSFALMGTVVLPTGGDAVGQGTTSFILLVPFGTPLPGDFAFAATPTVQAAADADGDGTHLAYGSVVGVSRGIGPIGVAAELSFLRDNDPAGHTTQSLAALSGAWQPAPDWQLDLGTAIGLNRDTADSRVYFGVTRRF